MSYPNRTLLFVSAPYNHHDKDVVAERLKVTAQYCMMMRNNAITAINPTLYGLTLLDHSKVVEKVGFDSWDNHCFDILANCDKIHVLMLNGWENSRGVIAEIEFASGRNIPVQFIRPDSIRL